MRVVMRAMTVMMSMVDGGDLRWRGREALNCPLTNQALISLIH